MPMSESDLITCLSAIQKLIMQNEIAYSHELIGKLPTISGAGDRNKENNKNTLNHLKDNGYITKELVRLEENGYQTNKLQLPLKEKNFWKML